MRASAPRLLLACTERLVLFIDGNGDAPAADPTRQRHHRVRRLRKQRMIVIPAGSFRPCQIGHVDDPEAGVPAARPHLVAEAQRMVQTVAPAGPGGRLAAGDVLSGHPPA